MLVSRVEACFREQCWHITNRISNSSKSRGKHSGRISNISKIPECQQNIWFPICPACQDTRRSKCQCFPNQKWIKNDTSSNPSKWYWGLRGPTSVTSLVNLSKTSMTIPTWKKRLASIALWWIIHYSVEACAFETLLQKISHKPRQAFLKGRNEWGLINSKCKFPPEKQNWMEKLTAETEKSTAN